jgi:23S rRNA U2552 (ribose-2'-O)-methylase RlmE/FtsJ
MHPHVSIGLVFISRSRLHAAWYELELMQLSEFPMSINDPMARGGIRRYLDTVKPEEYLPDTGEVPLSELSLRGLADLYGSDKGSIKHHYTDVYENLIGDLANTVSRQDLSLRILELGVACGASLRMWATYLPSSLIYGIDVRHECLTLCSDLKNVSIIQADVTAVSTFNNLVDKAPFDLIVDDASHISEDIVSTFNSSWSLLRSSGYYVIEDLGCTYSQAYTDKFRCNFNPDAVNDRSAFIEHFDKCLKACDSRSEIATLSYYPQLLCIKKI